jgi:hypothetical protein
MKTKINWSYLASLILTVFVYWLPLDFGGNILHWLLAIVLIGLYIYMLHLSFKALPKSARTSVALWVTNSLAILHLTLIYISLVFSSTATIIVGALLGAILYYIVTRQVDQKIK